MARVYVTAIIGDDGEYHYAPAFMENGKEEILGDKNPMYFDRIEDANTYLTHRLELRQREDEAEPFSPDEALEFINSVHWKFAKTYAKFAPHEYLIKSKLPFDKQLEFERFVATCKKYAVDGYYYRRKNKYLIIDPWYYWPCGYDNLDADLINRAESSSLHLENGIYRYKGPST